MKTKLIAGILSVVITTASLTGCASSAPQEESSVPDSTEETMVISSDSEDTGEEISLPETSVELSDKNATVPYAGEDFMTLQFAAGGTTLYARGVKGDGSFFWGHMEREEDFFQEFDVNVGENMSALNMAVDGQGRCHILWMSVKEEELNGQNINRITFEKSCITIVDREGNLEKEIDITDIFASDPVRPFCFAVDEEGNYYMERKNKLVQILPDGTPGKTVASDGWIEALGIGRSGSVYCIYYNGASDINLVKLEEDSFRLCDAKLPEAPAKYTGIYAGIDSELVIFNIESGVFAVDEDEVEARVPATEMPIRGERLVGYGMLADGRACIVEQKDKTVIFYYIPVVK